MALGLFCHGLDDGAGGGQLLAELAGVLGAGDGLEAVAGAGAGLTADAGDRPASAPPTSLPVGDLAGEDLADLLHGEVSDLAVGVDDDGDAVQGDGGAGQACAGLLVLQGAGGKADVGGAVGRRPRCRRRSRWRRR